MKNEKWHLHFSHSERRLLILGLNTMRCHLIQEGKHTDMVDDVLLKVLSKKVKKIKVKYI